MTVDINKLFNTGLQESLDRFAIAETKKTGTLRSGNSGMMTEDGKIYGAEPATVYLRMQGIITGLTTPEVELMFDAGRRNEDHWLDVLNLGKEKLAQDYTFRCEEDIPTKWHTDNGMPVTGRPDIVVCDKNGDPLKGIELKQNMSINSMYKSRIKLEPQFSHLIQAAHYMWQLEVPFDLWYTNRTIHTVPERMRYYWDVPLHHPNVEYSYIRLGKLNKKGNPTKHKINIEEYLKGKLEEPRKFFYDAEKIKQFVQGYALKLDDNGQLWFKNITPLHLYDTPDNTEWQKTVITTEGIMRFYNYVSTIEENGVVPIAQTNVDFKGKKLGWKYSMYSDLDELHPDNHQGRPLKDWASAVKNKFKDLNK